MQTGLCPGCGTRQRYSPVTDGTAREVVCRTCGKRGLVGWRWPKGKLRPACSRCGALLHAAEARMNLFPALCIACWKLLG